MTALGSLQFLPSNVSNAVRSHCIFPTILTLVEELVYNAVDSESFKIDIGFDKDSKKVIVKDYGNNIIM